YEPSRKPRGITEFRRIRVRAEKQWLLRSGRSSACEHPAEPDVGQNLAHVTGIEVLDPLLSIEILDHGVIYHHAEKTAGRQQWIDLPERPCIDAPANKFSELFVIASNVCLKKLLR